MKAHWTEKSNEGFLFRIVADFITQIENKMEIANISRGKLANKLRISKGRVSQVLNDPGNISLLTIIKYARTLGMKVTVVAYEDGDAKNLKGPINAEIFKTCWEKCGKPQDFWAFQVNERIEPTISNLASEPIKIPDFSGSYISQPSWKWPLIDGALFQSQNVQAMAVTQPDICKREQLEA